MKTLILAAALGSAMVAAPAVASPARTLLRAAEVNYSKWASLTPEENEARARLDVLRAKVDALGDTVDSRVAWENMQVGLQDLARRFDRLAGLSERHEDRARLAAEISAGLWILEGQVSAAETVALLRGST